MDGWGDEAMGWMRDEWNGWVDKGMNGCVGDEWMGG